MKILLDLSKPIQLLDDTESYVVDTLAAAICHSNLTPALFWGDIVRDLKKSGLVELRNNEDIAVFKRGVDQLPIKLLARAPIIERVEKLAREAGKDKDGQE